MANSWKLYVNIKPIHVPCFFPSTQCVFSSAASWAFSKIKSSDSVRIDYLGWLDDMGACSQYQTNNTDNEFKRRFYGLVSIYFLLFPTLWMAIIPTVIKILFILKSSAQRDVSSLILKNNQIKKRDFLSYISMDGFQITRASSPICSPSM